ncbi:serine protease [Micromonospora sp. NPDC005173]|uniref:S1 family peptidase n=1 Tax=Micromonospora sp. NPDC005173 TaxID=3157165 RepID=UPI0033BF018E
MHPVSPHISRLALVRGAMRGSGCLIGRDLVLTAGHVVGPLGASCRVRLHGTEERDGVVIWRANHLGLDAALVQVPQAGWPEGTPASRYGELVGPHPVECLTVGYPLASVNADGESKLDENPWLVAPGTGIERDRYALNSILIPPHKTVDTHSGPRPGWAGQSGAALLTGDGRYVLGVVIAEPENYGPGRLEAVRISSLAKDELFRTWVGIAPDSIVGLTAKGRADHVRLPPGIVPHADEVASLDGLMRNLREECLPFVAPFDDTTPTHPDRLLERLSESAGRSGVLLVGAAGAGKTRTCFEVGKRAAEDGWTVLHVKAGEPLVTNVDVADALQRVGTKRTLVILDYLNECRGLDLPGLRQQVLPEARRQHIHVALLASARPGWQLQTEAQLSPLFDIVRLAPDSEHTAKIRKQVVTSLAPTALRVLDDEQRLLELCGDRPIIAMLIALEAEARAKARRLKRALPSIRPGELIDWLNRRLREDGLIPQSANLITDQEPSVELQTCVAMAVAGPQERTSLVACGGRVAGGDTERADHLLGILLTMGWMVTSGGQYMTVHDIVTDQLIDNSFHRTGSGSVRSSVADRILSASLTRGRTIGRYATNLGRLMRDLALEERSAPIKEYCGRWLEKHGPEVARLLAEQQDEGAYALGAVMDNPAWSPVAFGRWETIVAPWLSVHARTFPARHLLYKGLRASVSDNRLVRESIDWLGVHHNRAEATFVLRPLLQHSLPDDLTRTTVRHALAWLTVHDTSLNAGFVLGALLERDLPEEHAATLVRHALTWLTHHDTTPNAGFVLGPLLERDLADEHAATLVQHALTWLTHHDTTPNARFVLGPLLKRDLADEHAATLVQHALTWLTHHDTTPNAGFVLQPLLERDLPDKHAATLVQHALTWLTHHDTTPNARFVLRPLLQRDLPSEHVATIVRDASTWLADHGATPEAGFLLRALLQRDLPTEHVATIVRVAFTWLADHGATPEAGFVLRALLDRDLPDQHTIAVRHALTWLADYAATPDAGFVLRPLLQRGLPTEQATIVVRHVLTWLTEHSAASDADFVLGPLLDRDLTNEQAATVIQHVVTWLTKHSATLNAQFVLQPLLQRDLPDEHAAAVVQHVLTWLTKHSATLNAGFVLRPLLQQRGLPDEQAALVLRHTITWLDDHATLLDAGFVLQPLLQLPLRDEQPAAVRHALTWLTKHSATPNADFVLRPLLQQRGLPDEQAALVLRHTITWLDDHATLLDAGFVLRPLLQLPLRDEQPAAVRHALTWLTKHSATPNAGFVLRPLLQQRRLPTEQAATVLRQAITWLTNHATLPSAGFVLQPLLQHPLPDEHPAAVRHALTWLAKHTATVQARFVLRPLLQCHLSDEQAAAAIRHARTWLTHNATAPGASALRVLLNRWLPPEDRL